jgi:glucosylceramidase
MMDRTRRKFLKAASVTAASLAVSSRIPTWAAPAASSVKVWATSGQRRYQELAPLAWTETTAAADAITLYPTATKQEILGFGAAMTDATCYLLGQQTESERQAILHDFFAPSEMGFNVCRTCIGSSDYSRNVYSFDESDTPDPELKKFSIDHDKAYILPALRDARKLNPELFLFSSPWSPPGWMKSSGTMLGGAMRKHSYAPYAEYFRRFLEDYQAEGVRIDAVTVQNEADADQDGRMPACLWGQEYEIEFVKSHLGPVLRKAGFKTKIWVLDHNYNLWGRAMDELSDSAAYEYIDGIAWHGYAGKPADMTRVHDAFPQKNAYWTEGGPDVNAPDYQTDYTKWAETFNEVLNNWARSITAWNLVLDEKGNPNIGPFPCGGVITVENATHEVTRSGQYWAFAHFSKHLKRGAKVIQTSSKAQADGPVSHLAARNPDGSYVAILTNSGPEKKVQLVIGSKTLECTLPTNSVHTLQWA